MLLYYRVTMLRIKFTTVLLCIALCSGCATVRGPEVSQEEVAQAQRILEVKALQFKIAQIKKINAIGYELIDAIPKEDIKVKSRPFLGLFTMDNREIPQRLFDKEPESGVFVAFVLEGTPAYDAGIIPGDVIVGVGERVVKKATHLSKYEYRLRAHPQEEVVLKVLRDDGIKEILLKVRILPIDVRFSVVDHHSVNAAASNHRIFVTYGLLNFTKSDDEIAAVIGHELAHLARGHINKKIGTEVIKFVASITLGIAAEALAPGAGGAVVRGVSGVGDVFSKKFSRDLEREADYFGVQYIYNAGYDPEVAATFHERFAIEIPATMIQNYLSSHPSSPERTVRIHKAIEEIYNTSKTKANNASTANSKK